MITPPRYINFPTQHSGATKVHAAATWLVKEMQASFQVDCPHISAIHAAVTPQPAPSPNNCVRVHVNSNTLIETMLNMDGT